MPIFVGFFGWINERREWREIRPHDKHTNLIYIKLLITSTAHVYLHYNLHIIKSFTDNFQSH